MRLIAALKTIIECEHAAEDTANKEELRKLSEISGAASVALVQGIRRDLIAMQVFRGLMLDTFKHSSLEAMTDHAVMVADKLLESLDREGPAAAEPGPGGPGGTGAHAER